jgi:hypothetical protein
VFLAIKTWNLCLSLLRDSVAWGRDMVTANETNQPRVSEAIWGLAVAICLILLSTVTRIFVKLVWPAEDKFFLDDYIIIFVTVCFVSVTFIMIL